MRGGGGLLVNVPGNYSKANPVPTALSLSHTHTPLCRVRTPVPESGPPPAARLNPGVTPLFDTKSDLLRCSAQEQAVVYWACTRCAFVEIQGKQLNDSATSFLFMDNLK